ncbi:hypothetical protein GCM10010497_16630 [Streptomyces cinereoruber]|uniref:Uncharacterized protein n=1 Tax=Streptomyces cinereoruber TaxID=67260 RepID=A0AAV4KGR0_9ACTN|nr:hypothetical protein GCM10010497_16630 [Streptomyces cinereoruber]
MVADQFPDGVQGAGGGRADRLLGEAGEGREEVGRELEPHGHQGGVELPGRRGAVSGGAGRDGEATGVPDDQMFEGVVHSGILPLFRTHVHAVFDRDRARAPGSEADGWRAGFREPA